MNLIKNKIINIRGFFIIFFLTFFLILILRLASKDKALQEENIETFVVKTEKVTLRDNKPEYLFYGNIQAQNKVDIISQLSGKIVSISPKVISNEYFEKGEKIFELESFNYRQELIKRKSQLEEMKNELKSQNLIYTEIEKQQILSKKKSRRSSYRSIYK